MGEYELQQGGSFRLKLSELKITALTTMEGGSAEIVGANFCRPISERMGC